MKNLVEKLAKIQQELKAPKNQRNSFGGYNYRSCEDILEAVKPLLGGLILTLNDDIIQVGNRVYVKATATITDGEHSISTSANAREPESKKGMDESQITGAASSYARKYALNGLFDIDDTKDADATNTHGKDDSDFKKDAVAQKKATTKAIRQAIDEGKEYTEPTPQKPLKERFDNAMQWLKSQTPETYLNAAKSYKDAINALYKKLHDKGVASWYEEMSKEFDRVTSIDDEIKY